MNTLIALVVIACWCLTVWAVSQCLKAPSIYDKRGRR